VESAAFQVLLQLRKFNFPTRDAFTSVLDVLDRLLRPSLWMSKHCELSASFSDVLQFYYSMTTILYRLSVNFNGEMCWTQKKNRITLFRRTKFPLLVPCNIKPSHEQQLAN